MDLVAVIAKHSILKQTRSDNKMDHATFKKPTPTKRAFQVLQGKADSALR